MIATRQERWNSFGANRVSLIETSPEKFLINPIKFPLEHRLNEQQVVDFLEMVGPLAGKKVCEVGCARGEVSVFLAKRGGQVIACDVGAHLVESARALAKVNEVECEFFTASITDLPLQAHAYDVVVGLALLHHLSEADLVKALKETHRILRAGGVAVFYETIENSKMFEFLQNLFPVGERGSHYYRPSILQRKRWAEHLKNLDERALTTKELIEAGKEFGAVRIYPYGLLVRLDRLIGRRFNHYLDAVDRALFRFAPSQHFCRFALVGYRK